MFTGNVSEPFDPHSFTRLFTLTVSIAVSLAIKLAVSPVFSPNRLIDVPLMRVLSQLKTP